MIVNFDDSLNHRLYFSSEKTGEKTIIRITKTETDRLFLSSDEDSENLKDYFTVKKINSFVENAKKPTQATNSVIKRYKQGNLLNFFKKKQ